MMRWQSRGLFWSAVDAKQAQPERTVINARKAIDTWWKTVLVVARRHPSVYIAPLLLSCACLAGGLIGVALAAQQVEQQARDDARTVASQAAAALAVQLGGGATQPAAALATLAAELPRATELLGVLPRLAPRLLQQAPAGTVRQLLLSPFGVVAAVVAPASGSGAAANAPAVYTTPGTGAATGGAAVGSNLLTDSATRSDVLRAIRAQAPAQGVSSPAAVGAGSPDVLLITHYPVYVSSVAAEETWGNGGAISVGDCAGLCYFPGNRTRLWGFSSSLVSLTALARSSPSGLDGLPGLGYTYRIALPAAAGASAAAVLAESSPPPPAGAGGKRTLAVPVPLLGALEDAQPTLTLHHSKDWRPHWEGPLSAVVVLASLALGVLLFALLLNHWRHTDMLRAMLPEKVLAVLGTGSSYYQHFDCVTVLYADVVRYTARQQQQQQEGGGGLPPLEVVKLLNDVHSMYEAIIEKYGLVRIRRSGESFMCVGGCPTPDEPVAVAARVAACARDMVRATARFTSDSGFAVQLRVGLHSGPVVAAVVGTKMPRFSLFGDVVDVAYYMEATSHAMAVHVSDRTSQLVVSAGDPTLQLIPRARMDIIGQGSMETAWLKIDGLPTPARAAAAAAATADADADAEEDETLLPSAALASDAAAAVARESQHGKGRRGGGRHGSSGDGADAHAAVRLDVPLPGGGVGGSSDDDGSSSADDDEADAKRV